MLRPDFDRVEQLAIDRAVKAAGARYGLVQVRGVGIAATLPGARQVIEIDPVTSFPVEPDVDGLYFPEDLPQDSGKELS